MRPAIESRMASISSGSEPSCAHRLSGSASDRHRRRRRGLTRATPTSASVRREPEKSLLYQVVAEHLEALLARAAERADGSGLPVFVERELRPRALRRLRKGRPRRVQLQGSRVLPVLRRTSHGGDGRAPRLRYQIAFDRELCRRVRNIFVRAVLGLRWRVSARPRRWGVPVRAVRAARRGRAATHGREDPFAGHVIAAPPRRWRSRPRGHRSRGADGFAGARREFTLRITSPKEGCAAVDGFSLHANVRIAARDRPRLERLCRYLVRPPISDARLALAEHGSIALELKTPYSDGTTHFVFDPMTFLARLAALVPPPRAHRVVYHGVLASAASVRRDIVPHVLRAESGDDERAEAQVTEASGSRPSTRSRNYTWAELMKRVFLIDVLRCPSGGSRRLMAAITNTDTIARILRCLCIVESASARGPSGRRSSSRPTRSPPRPRLTDPGCRAVCNPPPPFRPPWTVSTAPPNGIRQPSGAEPPAMRTRTPLLQELNSQSIARCARMPSSASTCAPIQTRS